MKKIIIEALKHRATWAAFFLVLSGLGVSTHPVVQEAITTIGTQAAGDEAARDAKGG